MTDSLVLEGVGVQGEVGWLARNLTLAMQAGQVLAVVGPESSESTRALLAIAGAVRPDEGQVLPAGGPTAVGWIPGGPGLTAGKTVMDHLAEAAMVRKRPKMKPSERQERLTQVGLAAQAARRVETLDNSEKVRLGMAMALVRPAGVVCLPAIDAGLTPAMVAEIWALVFSLAATGVVVVSGCAVADPRCSLALDLWRYAS